MHARIEQLLSRCDGEPLAAEVAAHVDACRECRDALARLETTRRELASLPTLAPPRDLWPQVAAAAARRRHRRRPLALAAGLVLATAAAALTAHTTLDDPPGPQESVVAVEPALPDPVTDRDQLERLADRSAAMERQLRALRASAPSVVRVGHQLGRARVESRLRALDYGLYRSAATGEDVELRRAFWNERVRLLDTMLQMERAELINNDLADYRLVPVRQDR